MLGQGLARWRENTLKICFSKSQSAKFDEPEVFGAKTYSPEPAKAKAKAKASSLLESLKAAEDFWNVGVTTTERSAGLDRADKRRPRGSDSAIRRKRVSPQPSPGASPR